MDRTCKDLWECQWDRIFKTDVEVKGHVDSYALADVLNPRDALYGGRCDIFALHDQSTDRSVIKYVDVQSLYPYVCKSKHYPVGHPRCLIGPNLRGLDVNSYEELIKCKVLPPRGLRIPLMLGGSYITEYVSNGPKNYAYRTGDGKQLVKVKGFTLNLVASQQLTFDVMKEMAISEQEEHTIVTESRKIRKI